jgi:Fe-S cluster biogenesis protein NfuA
VRVFKRATSLGGVESLIEHRASIEGPASPVPLDLLRLSIGLESPGDLIADLEQALASLPDEVPGDAATVAAGEAALSPIESVLENHVRAMLRERGGDLEVRTFADGVLVLDMLGSPGASVLLQLAIGNTIRHYLPEVQTVQIMAGQESAADHGGATMDRVQGLLDDVINPAIKAHGGGVVLNRIEGDTVFLNFEGGCQGCAMAELTLRQGVEPILVAQIPKILAIVDETDHAAGTAPYFKTKKS